MAENRHFDPDCRGCICSNCEPTGTKALKERTDAWLTANTNLTKAAKDWPKTVTDDGEQQPSVDATDVLVLANWLYSGEAYGRD